MAYADGVVRVWCKFMLTAEGQPIAIFNLQNLAEIQRVLQEEEFVASQLE